MLALLARNEVRKVVALLDARPPADHLGRTADAVKVLDTLEADEPDFVPARAGRGVYLARPGERDAAHADAAEVPKRNPSPLFRYQIAGLFALTSATHPKDADRAVELLASALQDRTGLEYEATDPELKSLGDDRRFKDVLAAARKLAGTRAGDVLVNTGERFDGSPDDLHSVMPHEAGHSVGIGNSTNPNAVMYTQYSGTRAGLHSSDVTAVRALYGARAADQHESRHGTTTTARATNVGRCPPLRPGGEGGRHGVRRAPVRAGGVVPPADRRRRLRTTRLDRPARRAVTGAGERRQQ